MSEEVLWKPVPGFEGRYEVSNTGLVRSVSRLVRTIKRNGEEGLRRIKSVVMKLHTWGAKYPGLVMETETGERTRQMVHRLVALAFIPNPNNLPQVNHLDANTLNARVDNLEWSTQGDNVKHAYRLGNRKSGSEHHFAHLPRSDQGWCQAAA